VRNDFRFGEKLLGVQCHRRSGTWAAVEDDRIGRAGRFAYLAPDLSKPRVAWSVEDQSQRPFFVVPNEQYDAPEEIGITQLRRCDQKMSLQRHGNRNRGVSRPG